MKLCKKISKKDYSRLEKQLFDEMYRSAGRELVKKMFNVLETRYNSINWFYTPLKSLKNKRPYDYCNSGKHIQIRQLLERIEYGVFS